MSGQESAVDAGKAWATYLDHSVPVNGENCKPCLMAETLNKGCAEGTALYEAYRLTRVMPPRADQDQTDTQDAPMTAAPEVPPAV